ncbi:hypothetical protein ANCCAN_14958 [Ancylostoma caninum]|uniref:Uncharacterized protein n=1 Tax=Ancylostoma caninum TaxID=29170 RepID=A0A368G3U3_ANCCA|nr:hypothetical protein ANCCAN_14958 [Ancylostoma caninum]
MYNHPTTLPNLSLWTQQRGRPPCLVRAMSRPIHLKAPKLKNQTTNSSSTKTSQTTDTGSQCGERWHLVRNLRCLLTSVMTNA